MIQLGEQYRVVNTRNHGFQLGDIITAEAFFTDSKSSADFSCPKYPVVGVEGEYILFKTNEPGRISRRRWHKSNLEEVCICLENK